MSVFASSTLPDSQPTMDTEPMTDLEPDTDTDMLSDTESLTDSQLGLVDTDPMAITEPAPEVDLTPMTDLAPEPDLTLPTNLVAALMTALTAAMPPATGPSSTDNEPPTFHLFPALPNELTYQIWTDAICYNWGITTNSNAPLPRTPGAGLACDEARRILEATHVLVHRRIGDPITVQGMSWVNPARHIYLWNLQYNDWHAVSDHVHHLVVVLRAGMSLNSMENAIRQRRGNVSRVRAQLKTITILTTDKILLRTPDSDVLNERSDARYWQLWRGSDGHLFTGDGLDWTPLYRDLEAGGEPVNAAWPLGETWAQSAFAGFPLGKPKVYWRTPQQALASQD